MAIRTITLRACAKINLTLHVGASRADGFHEVRTVLQSIDLADELAISARRGPFRIVCRTAEVPADRTNLVWRAADALWQALGRDGEARDAHVRLRKVIPPGAGLGGGSADAAAALVGLNRIWGSTLSRADLMPIAARIGSDVPFFLLGGTALAVGRGEQLFPLIDVVPLPVVVVKPPVAVATADAYRWFDADGRRPAVAVDWIDVGWPTGPIQRSNDLEGPVSSRHPVIGEVVRACRRAGAVAAAMTGSGSAVWAVFAQPGLRQGLRALRRTGWQVFPTRTLTRRDAARRIGL